MKRSIRTIERSGVYSKHADTCMELIRNINEDQSFTSCCTECVLVKSPIVHLRLDEVIFEMVAVEISIFNVIVSDLSSILLNFIVHVLLRRVIEDTSLLLICIAGY